MIQCFKVKRKFDPPVCDVKNRAASLRGGAVVSNDFCFRIDSDECETDIG